METESDIVFGDIVSVVCCSYNNFQFFEDCINSIAMQDYPAIEVIFTDDCSEINAYNDFVERVKARLSGSANISYKLLRNSINQGTVINAANGIKEAKGKIILPLAFDDLFYEKSTIRNIVNFFIDNKAKFVTTKRLNFNEDSEDKQVFSENPSPAEVAILKKDNLSIIEYILTKQNFIGGCNTYFTKELFLQCDFDYRYRLVEDLPFYYKLLMSGEKLFYMETSTILYRTAYQKKVSKGVAKDMVLFYSNLSKDTRLSRKKRRYSKFAKELYIYRNISKKNVFKLLLYPDCMLFKYRYKVKHR
ncbi:MAG: glycosyltransferase [Anaeroplasmataceae bacterium]|nr:glycosyltransferase [Anaeroplasmataceae bacterium]MDE6414477.1 glycosyltransferase [Anaeroplasmataceae bacterium]